MKTLTIKSRCKSNTTNIENEFIDTFMIKSNGEYVKVYLFLLRHLYNSDLSISYIADRLEYTENDVLRALKYWEKEKILSIEYDSEERIIGLDIASIAKRHTTPVVAEEPTPKEIKPVAPKSPSYKPRKEFKQLLFVAEQYLGKTLTKTDVETITYFYDTLNFPLNLIEYLIEYCVENGHQSMHYIQSVALAWSKESITTVDAAKDQISSYNKVAFSILKAFGITGRGPVTTEIQFADKWAKEMGFSTELIVEACNRTISNIHQPSFEYADSILNKWSENNVHHLSDLSVLDTAFSEAKKSKKAPVTRSVTPKKPTHNFQSRSYDMDSLEEQLLNSK